MVFRTFSFNNRGVYPVSGQFSNHPDTPHLSDTLRLEFILNQDDFTLSIYSKIFPKVPLPLFEKAKEIYESELEPSDSRLGGLYNNMALALVDLERYKEASELYDKAVSVMSSIEYGMLEVAITYLNMASAKEAEIGLLDAEETISHYLKKAEQILENFDKRDGYYAFVCEKCASVFGYYGYFNYEKQLIERAKRIYEGA